MTIRQRQSDRQGSGDQAESNTMTKKAKASNKIVTTTSIPEESRPIKVLS